MQLLELPHVRGVPGSAGRSAGGRGSRGQDAAAGVANRVHRALMLRSVMRFLVHVPSQTLDLLDGDILVRRYVVSTSRYGIGTETGSNKTPPGRFRIAEKFGDGAPEGEVFRGREPTGVLGREGEGEDNVQTRILWLDGLDAENANTRERYIYVHGTNQESQLGTPASHGCVRMSNWDVIDLYDRVEVGDEVFIDADGLPSGPLV